MFKIINGSTIHITRGDTAYMTLDLYDSTGKYILRDTDIVQLTVKENIDDNVFLFQKRLVEGQFKIESVDTKQLAFGNYIYDVQIIFENGDVNTVIEPSVFKICGEVTDNV